jgi:hypothetical protein
MTTEINAYYHARLSASADVDADYLRWISAITADVPAKNRREVLADVIAITNAYEAVKGA